MHKDKTNILGETVVFGKILEAYDTNILGISYRELHRKLGGIFGTVSISKAIADMTKRGQIFYYEIIDPAYRGYGCPCETCLPTYEYIYYPTGHGMEQFPEKIKQTEDDFRAELENEVETQ